MWIVAGSLIDGIFESGVMMVFVIALVVVVACAAVLATDNK